MAYIGRDVQYGALEKQDITGDGTTTVFTLDSAVASSASLIVSIGGVIQEPDTAYTADGTTLTFTSAPTAMSNCYVVFLGKELLNVAMRDAISFQTGTGDGVSATPITMSVSAPSAHSIMVMLNGVTQVPDTDYTVSGTTLTFTTAPASGIAILIYHLGYAANIGVPGNGTVSAEKISISGQAQGDIMYYNGSAWVLLPTGTAGQVLTSGGAGGNPSWA
jgi:hypothetical protein